MWKREKKREQKEINRRIAMGDDSNAVKQVGEAFPIHLWYDGIGEVNGYRSRRHIAG